MRTLLHRQLVAFGNAVRFLEATAAAGGGGVLGNEHGVIAPWRLASVILRLGGREALGDEIRGLLHHVRQTPRLQIRELASGETELLPEARAGELMKDALEIDHARYNRRGATVVSAAP